MSQPPAEPPAPLDAGRAPEAQSPLGARLRSGVAWWGLGNLISRLTRVAVHVVLAWVLDPTDYGIIAMTIAFMMVLQILSEFGVGTAVIQKQNMTDAYVSSAFWLNLVMSAVMAVVSWIGAPWLAVFYNEPRIELVVQVTAFGFIITSLRTLPMALLRKRLQFGLYAALDSVWNILSGALSIVLALCGAGYWSLLLPAMIVGALMLPAWFRAVRWRPERRIDWLALREVFSYSKNVVATSLLSVLIWNAGFVIAGHQFGPNEAGIYKFGMENAMFITINFAWLVGNVAMSGFALQQSEPERLRKSFVRVYEVLTATTLPFHALLFVLAPWLIGGVFPEKWAPAIPIFRILLIQHAVRGPLSHQPPFLFAIQRADVNVKYFGILTPVTLVAMYFGCRYYGLVGLAWAATVTQTVGTVTLTALMGRLIGWKGAVGYVEATAPYVAAITPSVLLAWGLAFGMDVAGVPKSVTFLVCGGLGVGLYGLLLLWLAPARSDRLLGELCPERFRPLVDRLLAFLRPPFANVPRAGI